MTETVATANRAPAHVPPDLVHDIGLGIGKEYLAGPYEFLAGLHDRYPGIFFDVSPALGNGWVIIKHDIAFSVSRDLNRFAVANMDIFPRDPDNYFRLIPFEIGPPDHRKFRNILDPMLSPKGVLQLEEKIRSLANTLIDSFIDRRECEFAAEFARPLPVSVFLSLMGLPLEMRDQFVTWVTSLIEFADRDVAKRIMGEIETYLASVIAEKRARPDDGAISRIVGAQIDGQPVPERDALGYTFFLFIAGIDTVYSSFNSIWAWMARNPDRVSEMIAAPGDISNQVEELYRAFGSSFSGRTVAQDAMIGGVQMKKGDRVMNLVPACNYDPDVYPDPRAIRFDRPRMPLLSFGAGIHSCMGSHLARLELKVSLQEWLKRIPSFGIKPGDTITYEPSSVIGPDRVPLVW